VNCRSSVESVQMTSKPGVDVGPGLAWLTPAYCHVASGIEAARAWFRLLCGTAGTFGCDAKGKAQAQTGEANNTDAQPRDGATRSSVEAAVMVVERRGRVIGSWVQVNRLGGRNLGV